MVGGLITHGLSNLVSVQNLPGTTETITRPSIGSLCFVFILSLFALALYASALIRLYMGAKNVSELHRKKVLIAIILIIIGFLLGMIFSSVIPMDIEDTSGMRTLSIQVGIIGFIGSLLIGFALVLLIHEIIEKRWHAYICFLLLLFFNFFTFWRLYTMPISGTLEDVVGSFIGIAAGDQILSGITYFAFAVLYFSVYEYENFDQSVEYDTKPCPDCGKLLVTLENRGIFCESCGALIYDDPQTIYKKCIECGSMAMTVSHIGLANCRECGHFTSNYLRDYHLRKTE